MAGPSLGRNDARMIRIYAACCYLLAGSLVACAGGQPLDHGNGAHDPADGAGGKSTTTGHGGRSGGGMAGSGGDGGASGSMGTGGNGGADWDASAGRGGAGGADFDASGGRGGAGGTGFDASAGRGGFSDATGPDGSLDRANTNDAADLGHVGDTGSIEGGDAEGGTCGPVFCFDVFECWIFFPQCGYTACELLACKK
jgi:hypothetical protein